MIIYTTWTDQLQSFKQMFAGHEVSLLPEKYQGLSCDLLIFPGGEDVHPSRYGARMPSNQMFEEWTNPARDEREFAILRDIMVKRFRPSRILGVCRGLQLINVAMGGTLVYDIATRYGKAHSSHHEIRWLVENVFSPVMQVNSMHHQAISRTGDNMTPMILGVEPSTTLIEAIAWGTEILAFQFHPELWGNEEEKRVFSENILKWVRGENIVSHRVEQVERPSRRKSMTLSQYGLEPGNIEVDASEALQAFASAWVTSVGTDSSDDDDDEMEEDEMEDDE